MSKHCFLIHALTNLHVGSGDSHYGIIDNLVQRDSLTKYPGIHASSLKGALRKAFEQRPGENQARLRTIFGDGPKGENSPGQAGKYHISPAYLLSLPVRSDKMPFVRVTSPALIKDLLDNQQAFGFTLDAQSALVALQTLVKGLNERKSLRSNLIHAILEHHATKVTAGFSIEEKHIEPLESLFGENLVVVPDTELSTYCGENRLPVVARNCLENGISRNLWYEEIVPRQTRFWCWLLKKDTDISLTIAWNELLKQPVQIGANACIGYGFGQLKML